MPDRNVMLGLIALIAIGFVALIVGNYLHSAESNDTAGGSLQLYEYPTDVVRLTCANCGQAIQKERSKLGDDDAHPQTRKQEPPEI